MATTPHSGQKVPSTGSNIRRTIVVGVSGPSSSGKTTLARLLRSIFNPPAEISSSDQEAAVRSFILHEDDFYKPDDRIPVTTTASGKLVQDWDTIDALNVSQLASTLSYVRENGHLPPTLKSKEDLNDAGDSGVDTADIQLLRDKVGPRLGRALQTKGEDQSDTAAKAGLSIAFLDGFLLYAPPGDGSHPLSPVRSRIDIPLFLPTTYTLLKQRRESRTGYVTIGPAPTPVVKAAEENAARASATDGGGEEADTSSANGDEPEQDFDPPTQNFWTDPPGYVDDIVWPRYISDHSWLLIPESRRPGNIDELKELVGEGVNVRRDAGVIVAPGNGEASMVELLEWAVEEVVQGIAGLI